MSLSAAGGAMTATMLACHSDVFAAGAIHAGGMYKGATTVSGSAYAPFGRQHLFAGPQRPTGVAVLRLAEAAAVAGAGLPWQRRYQHQPDQWAAGGASVPAELITWLFLKDNRR